MSHPLQIPLQLNFTMNCSVFQSSNLSHKSKHFHLQGVIAKNLLEKIPLCGSQCFDDSFLRVLLSNGGSLVIEQTEALVSIDVNGGHSMLGQGTSQERAVLDVNLAAAKRIARELRLRDIGGIIVVDFIDMADECKWQS